MNLGDMWSVGVGAPGRVVTIRVTHADALTTPVDALALKYAQEAYGADRAALLQLGKTEDAGDLPEPGQVLRIATRGAISARNLLLVGTVPLQYFEYAEIREFARRAVGAAQTLKPQPTELGMTIHGVGYGLDEAEAFTAQLAGLLDALRREEWPDALQTVTILERDAKRAQRLGHILENVLPEKVGQQFARRPASRTTKRDTAASAQLESAGLGSRDKRHVFVAMQFGTDTDDLFHYGIQAAVKANAFLCERIDTTTFTGDILAQIKARIDSASLIVADLTGANPNVYLEVGYAWGRNIPTVLLAREAAELRFDVRGQRCLMYSSIRDLEERLTKEIHQLVGAPVT